MQQPQILLASSSPRRRELMAWMKMPFTATSADIDESRRKNESALEHVRRLAREKAEKVFEEKHREAVILAADTIVIKNDHVLEKPQTERQAVEMLVELRKTTHRVVTAICIIQPDGIRREDVCISEVLMRDYSNEEIQRYVASGDPMDKAGAYAIQNGTFNPAPEFKGCFASVMGFPFCHIERNFRKIDGYNWIPVAAICQQNLRYVCPIFAKVLNGENIG
jgi:septum formation protein